MEIIIEIKNRKIKLRLICDKDEVDFSSIPNEYALSESLLPEIENIISRNKLEIKDIRKINVESDQEDNFTTTRLAKSVANVWNCNFEN